MAFSVCVATKTYAQDSGTCGPNLVWILDGNGANKTLIITGTGDMSNFTSGSAPWYAERQNIKTLTIDNSVTTLGNYAFADCQYMTTATIGTVVTSIGNNTFAGCSQLTSITIPDNITSVGTNAFLNCTNLTTVNYNPFNCTTMGSSSGAVFQGCSNFSILNIGSGVTYLAPYAFKNATGLVTVVVPTNVRSAGEQIFSGCSSLTNLTIPFIGASASAPTSYSSSASQAGVFGYIFGNVSYTGGTAVTQDRYGSSAGTYSTTTFYIPTSLRSVTISNDYTIPFGAFSGFSMLTNISINAVNSTAGELTIGNSVMLIDPAAFKGCTGITTVNFNATNCANINVVNTYPVFSGTSNFSTLNIGNAVTTIPDNLFYGCGTITGPLVLPQTLKYIGYRSFYSCRGISGTLTIPATTPDFVIGEDAFKFCSGITGALTIPQNVTTLGSGAFNYCSAITAVNFEATNCTGNPSSAVFGENCTALTAMTIGSNVTRIPDFLFDGCKFITSSLTVPSGVKYIGNYAFNNCSKITSQNMDVSFVDKIGNYSFYNCMKLDGYCQVKDTVGNYAFGLCIGLDSVSIPATAKTLGDDAFFSCLGLRTINFNATNCQTMGSNTLPVFAGCSNVNKLNIASDVTRIPDNAFFSLSGLRSVDIPQSVTYIGNQAFKNCTGLTSFTAPTSVLRIGEAALSGCAALVDVTIPIVGRTVLGTTNTSSTSNTNNYNYFYPFGYIFGTTSYTGGTGVSQSYFRQFRYDYVMSTITETYYLPTALRRVAVTDGTAISFYAFNNCAQLTEITLPNTLTEIREAAFKNCTGLTEATVPENVTTIGKNAFQNCTGLKTLNYYPTNCTTNGGSATPAFQGCTNLKKINISNNVTRIQDYSFKGMTGLDSIISFANTVPASYVNSFNDLTAADIAVVVPCGTLSSYQAEFGWQDFNDMTERCNSYTITVAAGTHGTVTPAGNQTVAFGGNKAFTFAPDANYEIDEVLVDGVADATAATTGAYEFENVNANHSLAVTFKAIEFTITVSADANGTITPNANQTVNSGSNASFVFTPNTDYAINQVLIDGVNNAQAVADGNYTFSNIVADHSISVTFVALTSVSITTATNDNNGGTAIIADGGTNTTNGVYDLNDNVTLYALPLLNYSFTGWNDGNNDNPRVVVASANATFTATFSACDLDALTNALAACGSSVDSLELVIMGLSNDTLSLQAQIATLESDTAALNANLAALTLELSQCDDNTVTLTNQINSLQAALDDCVGGTTGAPAATGQNAITVFPNPTKASVTIQSEALVNRIELFDYTGKMILSKELNDHSSVVDMSALASGAYFIRMQSNGKVTTNKIIKE